MLPLFFMRATKGLKDNTESKNFKTYLYLI